MFESQNFMGEQDYKCDGTQGYFKIKDSKAEVIYVCNQCGESRKFIPVLNKDKKTIWERIKEVRKKNG